MTLFNRKKKRDKPKKVRTVRVGTYKKWTGLLWLLLIGSVSFGFYKNFTAIDTHTIYETTLVEKELVDTNQIENFVSEFAHVYYAWENQEDAIEKRNNTLENYLTEELHSLNSEVVRKDIPISSSVSSVQIWSVSQESDQTFAVTFSVNQRIKEEDDEKNSRSAYTVTVYVDDSDNMIIIKNPTLAHLPSKASYEPPLLEDDASLDTDTREEIDAFLTTFFTLYPTASENELAYYVEENVLPLIGKEYTFSELVGPIYIQQGENVFVSVTVKYLDEETKADQLSQYELLLSKKETWKIIE